MKNNQIEIIKIKLKDLDEFARTIPDHPAFRDLAPISLVRALSQSRNPRGEPDDTALLVAMCDQSCVGYHGLLPGLLKNNDNTSKVSWLVTFYLDPGHRGKGYGKRLVSEIQNENIDLVTTGITRGAEGVYRSAGFKQLGELPYYQLRLERLRFLKRFSYPADSETAVLAIFNPLKRLGDWSYRLTKSIAYRVAFQKLKSNKKPFKSKPVHQLAKELTAIVERQSLPVSFYCNIDRINWMLRHPWVVSRGEAKKDVTNYYFSIVRDQFKFVPFEIYTADGKTRIGYVVLSLSSKKNKTTVKILNYGFNDPDDCIIAGHLGLKYAKDCLADRIEFPAGLDGFFRTATGLNRLLKRKKRLYLYYPKSDGSPLALFADKIRLDYCDSDTAFT